ncbi:MAG: hypothetical protein ACI9OJ_002823, partial [Myxococcota bacterium]
SSMGTGATTGISSYPGCELFEGNDYTESSELAFVFTVDTEQEVVITPTAVGDSPTVNVHVLADSGAGCTLGNSDCIAKSYDAATFLASPTVTYYVIFDRTDAAVATFDLDVTCTAAGGAGDSCAAPLPIDTMPVTLTGNTTQFTNQHDTTEDCSTAFGDGSLTPDVVYSFTPTETGTYTFDLEVDPAGPSIITVRTACDGACVDSSGDLYEGGSAEFVLDADTLYYLFLDGQEASEAGAFSLTISPPVPLGPAAKLVINEVDYDQTSTDLAEFIEIFNAGDTTATLSEYTVELVDGVSDTAGAYTTIELGNAGATLAPGAYLVIGVEAVVSALPADTLSVVSSKSGFIQNGPDGVRLLHADTVIDGLAYQGAVAGVTETAPAADDSGDGSLSRCANGADTDDNSVDFVKVDVTPGTANACTVAAPFAAAHAVFQAKCSPCHASASGSGEFGHAQGDEAAAYTSSQLDSYFLSDATKGEAALARILDGSMPNGKGCTGDPAQDSSNPDCLTSEQIAVIQTWVSNGQQD